MTTNPFTAPLHNALCLERLTLADLPGVDVIERASFSSPRSPTFYTRDITQNRLSSYWVVRPAGATKLLPAVLAYGGYWLPGDEAHIVVIATHPDWRRQRLGEWLLVEMLAVARHNQAQSATLEVRHFNTAARLFYARLGFAEVGLRKRYYRDTNEDAHLLTIFGLDDEAVWSGLATRLTRLRAQFLAS